jgi:hypothetical protein
MNINNEKLINIATRFFWENTHEDEQEKINIDISLSDSKNKKIKNFTIHFYRNYDHTPCGSEIIQARFYKNSFTLLLCSALNHEPSISNCKASENFSLSLISNPNS